MKTEKKKTLRELLRDAREDLFSFSDGRNYIDVLTRSGDTIRVTRRGNRIFHHKYSGWPLNRGLSIDPPYTPCLRTW